jgi:hypothetical protein
MARSGNQWIACGLLIGLGLTVGCSDDKPESYSEQRPDVSAVSPEDRGLQSKDVLAASDQMATDLLTDPQLNQSRTQWTLAITGFEDLTTDRSFSTNYDIFMERLRSLLSEKGQGRITLIENKATFNQLRNQELEGSGDQFGQGPAGGAPAPQAINPDYIMHGTVMDMPNRGTNYFLLEFTITNAQTRVQVWSRHYEVKTSR